MKSRSLVNSLIEYPFRYGIATILALLTIFCVNFRKMDVSETAAEWGQFGDYMGGLLNPIFGLISVVLIAATLKSQTQAAKLQAFDNQFYSLLSLHNSVLQSIDRKMDDKTVKYGRDCFKLFYRKIVNISQKDRVSMTTAYQRFLEKDGWEIEHYFRTVYHLFKHVKDGGLDIDASDGQKKRYYDLIKSQISQYELVLLWFNAQSINKGNWDVILGESIAKPFEHLNKTHLIENPPEIPDSEIEG